MRKIFFLLTFITFYSCGVKRKAVIPESSTIGIPELNVVTKSEIGIPLVSRESGYKYKAIKITKGRKAIPSYMINEIKAGDIYIHDSYTNKYDFYSNPSDDTFGLAIPRTGGKPIVYTFNVAGINFTQIKDVIEYTETMVPVPKKEYFKQEIIYNGRVGNALRFIYREYVDGYARPAFTQDLQYDLSESIIIGFRELRIEVLNATNTNIEYKVLSQFNK
ncbi:hypothetical protein [Flavobacterium sp. UBA7682]|uniref:hypothetical protein n=1 Tax=Flavobacterium sp. UBA7682 TaxID=1946560 RepID=UPI0025BCC52C|nr:hypothetical protein [Flavobacterium sp. UBA7682]